MKFKIRLFCFLIISAHYNCADLALLSQDLSRITIGVPTKFFSEQSSLMIYMVDHLGNQSIGTCSLDNKCFSENEVLVSQNDLKIATIQESDESCVLADLLKVQSAEQDLVMVHFEFDHAVRILKMLVVKNSFLEEDPIGIWEISFEPEKKLEINLGLSGTDADDFLASLVDDVDTERFDAANEQEPVSWVKRVKKYRAYLEVYMTMQYHRVKRTVGSWLAN